MPLNNQSPAAMDRSLTGGGITLNRQNSIGAGPAGLGPGPGGAGAPEQRCRLRQGVSPVPAPTPSAVATTSPGGTAVDRRPPTRDDKSSRQRVSSPVNFSILVLISPWFTSLWLKRVYVV